MRKVPPSDLPESAQAAPHISRPVAPPPVCSAPDERLPVAAQEPSTGTSAEVRTPSFVAGNAESPAAAPASMPPRRGAAPAASGRRSAAAGRSPAREPKSKQGTAGVHGLWGSLSEAAKKPMDQRRSRNAQAQAQAKTQAKTQAELRPQRPAAAPPADTSDGLLYTSPRQANPGAPFNQHPILGGTPAGRGPKPRSQKEITRELSGLRGELKRHVRGKPTRPISMMSIPAIIGRGIGRSIRLLAFLLVLTILMVGGAGVGVLMGYINTTDDVPEGLLTGGPRTSYMYDVQGNLMAKFTGADNIDRVDIDFKDVKGTYIDEAFIAIENERFYTDIGIDPKRIASAMLSALANGGEATHGGSTITQQTVKLVTGDDSRSAQRKIQEWYRAIQMNQKYGKEEILGLYLNLVPMGNSYVGIEAAANGYFNKKAKDMSLEECAYLAGIPKGPSLYNPRSESGLRNGLRRQRMVLAAMYNQGYISQAQYRKALNTELIFTEKPPAVSGTSILSYYAEYAKAEAIELLVSKKGFTEDQAVRLVNSGGIRMDTAMEPTVQTIVDKTLLDPDYYNYEPEQYENSPEKLQLGQAIINNANGTIAALGGGTNPKTGNLVLSHASDIQRQPGSTIKPLVAYGPGIDLGVITGATVFDDKEQALDPQRPGVLWPQNFGGHTYGPVSVRNALKESLNIEAVQVLFRVGQAEALQYMANMGMDRQADDNGPGIALGAFQHGFSPLEVAAGYATLANGGMYTKPISVLKITDKDGNVLVENKPEYTPVFHPETAFIMTDILHETMVGVTSSFGEVGLGAYEKYGWPVTGADGDTMFIAAKSGTTDDDKDHWFSGYSAYYSTSIWVGFDNNAQIPKEPWQNFRAPERVFMHTMNEIHQQLGLNNKNFECPANVISLQICNRSGLLASSYCGSHTMTEYFFADGALNPTAYCNLHRPAPVAPTPAASGQLPPAEPAATTP